MGIVAEVTGQWLDPLLSDVTRLQLMLEPYPERLMRIYPVSKRVNLPLWLHLSEKYAPAALTGCR
jgi:putative SOS response-associated peptidase YedK